MEERKRERGAVTVQLAKQLSALLQISYHMVLFKFKSAKLKKENYLRIILYIYLLSEENLIERGSGLELKLAH